MGELLQKIVTRIVPEPVVDLLEVIEVHDQEAYGTGGV